jgi:hypothetical protein
MGLKKMYLLYIFPPELHTHTNIWLYCSSLFNPVNKNSFGSVAKRKIGKAKDLSSPLRIYIHSDIIQWSKYWTLNCVLTCLKWLTQIIIMAASYYHFLFLTYDSNQNYHPGLSFHKETYSRYDNIPSEIIQTTTQTPPGKRECYAMKIACRLLECDTMWYGKH